MSLLNYFNKVPPKTSTVDHETENAELEEPMNSPGENFSSSRVGVKIQ